MRPSLIQEPGHELKQALYRQREKIARDLHDEIGATLTCLKLDLSWIERHASDEVAVRARQAREQLTQLASTSQHMVRDLRTSHDDRDLRAQIEAHIDHIAGRSDLAIQFDCNASALEFADDIRQLIFHTLLESLTNILKHAEATEVLVSLVVHPDSVSLEITDDGIGMPDAAEPGIGGFGLKGLKERARLVNGWLDTSSISGSGTSVLLHIPLGQSIVHAHGWSFADRDLDFSN